MTHALLSPLSPALRQAIEHATDPGHARWVELVRRTGGCSNPIHLAGDTMTVNTATGEVLHSYNTSAEPAGRLLVACGNRRASRCPSCSETYRADTYQLIRAGLVGGKAVPDTVRAHPRVFATFTAPSFGPVHNQPAGRPCRCRTRHRDDDPALGTPLDPGTYDYTGAVLWNAHAGALWAATTRNIRRELAALAGLTQRDLADVARLSFGKVAEYQRRGLVHFHAIVRIDGPDGPTTPAPAWATTELLEAAIRTAASKTTVTGPDTDALGDLSFTWGTQLDIRPITTGTQAGDLSDTAVAGYIAKYATKSAIDSCGTIDRPLTCTSCQGTGLATIWDTTPTGRRVVAARLDQDCPACSGTGSAEPLDALRTSAHARAMIRTAWTLGALPELAHLRLRKWAHMLGFRGHFSTKSRRYSTTLTALRTVRRTWRATQAHAAQGLTDLEPGTVLTLAHWRYAGCGYTPGQALLADAIAHDHQLNHRTTRDAAPTYQDGGTPPWLN